ncbi:MAG: hypothetical protein ACLR55_10280 [Roseburia sp.]
MNFFDITRFNRQDIELATTEIDLYYMLMQLSDEVYPLLAPEHKKVEIRADENCKVYGDADKLARIFNNILKKCHCLQQPGQYHCYFRMGGATGNRYPVQ